MKFFNFITYRNLFLVLLLFLFPIIAVAQAISGPNCVTPGVSYQYTLTGGGTGFKSYCVTNGTIQPNNTACLGTSATTITVKFNSGATVGYINVTAPAGSVEYEVNIAAIMQPGTVTSGSLAQYINYNTAPQTILCSPGSGGCPGNTFSYLWQYSYDQVNWNGTGVSTQDYSSGNLTQTTYFRRYTTTSATAQSGYSNVAVVNVYPELKVGVVVPASQIVNYNTNAQQLSLTNVTGGTGSYTYEWQSSTDGSNWISLGVHGTTFTPIALTAKTYYRVAVSSNGAIVYSAIAMVDVYPPLLIGSIVPAGQTILVNSTPLPLSISGISGGNGNYTYQWEVSADNNVFTPIGQASSATYSPGSLSSTVYYRITVMSNGVTVYSNSAMIDVRPHLTAGVISGSTSPVSYNGSPGLITGSPAAGGVCLSYSYQWQTSTDGVTFHDIPQATDINYTPVNLTQTITLRRKVTCGSETALSNDLTVVVSPLLIPGMLVPSAQVVAAGTIPEEITANAATGGSCSNYSYQWQQSTDGTSWTDIIGATDINYRPPALTSNTYYRRRVTCGSVAYTNICTITIGLVANCDMNYIRERIFLQPGITQRSVADAVTDPGSGKQTTRYFDGLGRLAQTVSKQASSTFKDVVAPVEYDEWGREVIKYLPYVAEATDGNYRCQPIPEQKTFNSTLFNGEDYYYGQIDYEASPLNRVNKTYAAGKNWVGASRGVATINGINTAADAVRIWSVATDANGVSSYNTPAGDNGKYAAGKLYKVITTDENGKQVIEFKDKAGKRLLKKVQLTAINDDGTGRDYAGWLCTYYLYDELDLLRCVVQPRGVELLEQNNWDFTALNGAILKEQCFQYEYDAFNRMIRKKVPGAGEVYMIYDVRDRVVFTQDANMRNNNQWLTTLYDNFNRPVITGLTTWTGTAAELQEVVSWQTANGSSPGIPVSITLSAPNTGGTHQASQKISMIDAFTSADEFTAAIVSADGNGNLVSTREGMTIYADPIPNGAAFTLLTKTGYDNYTNIPAASGLTGSIDNTYTGSNYLNTSYGSFPFPEPVNQSLQTKGLATWTQTKVLGTADQYLYSVMIYDKKGRAVQVKSKNNTNGTDIVTTQYTFSGQPLVNILKQEKAGGVNPQNHIVVTKNNYNELGQLNYVTKRINSTINGVTVDKPEVKILANEYDALGRLSKKSVGRKKDDDGDYTEEALQQLDHAYNIRGWLLGVNRNYLATEGQTTDGKVFGFELGYDKTANYAGDAFAKGEYNGNITGMLWKSDGDDIRRKYDFAYDAANRLLSADFKQQNAEDHLWNKSKVDFTMRMGDGTVLSNGALDPTKAYDANGNILRMKQWGLKVSGTVPIDDMVYSYYDHSNKLRMVEEQGAATAYNKLGDFTDLNTSGNDYGYDANGNMVIDLNKRIKGAGNPGEVMNSGGAIAYNHLNLPASIKVVDGSGNDKGTISYVYDATGNKLQKIVLEKTISVTYNNQPYTSDIKTTTTYLGGAVYESKAYENAALVSLAYTDKLQFMGHEEGRIRYTPALNDKPARFEYDYFIKDHLGNVRAVITDELQQNIYPAATLEGNLATSTDAVYKEKDYYNINVANIVLRSEVTGLPEYINKNGDPGQLDPPVNNNPNSNVTALSQKLYKLQGSSAGGVSGLGITLKVMSGDRIDIFGKSYYFENNAGENNYPLPVLDILSGLLGAPTGATAGKGVTATALNGITDVYNGVNNFLSNPDRGSGTIPKAYVNWILLDDNFKYISGNFDRVGAANILKDHKLLNIPVSRNGYLYVYVSNESPVRVFFDNLQVIHTKGPLLEETHYYPFGLTMAGISSKVLNTEYSDNKKQFNGIEHMTDLDLNQYDAFYRTFDPQTGRFCQIDPKIESADSWSAYTAMLDNPIRYMDPLGDSSKPGLLQGIADGFTGYFENTWNSVSHPEETLSNMFSAQSFKENAYNAATTGMYGTLKSAWNNMVTIKNEGAYGVGKIIGEKGAEVTATLATEGVGKYVRSVRLETMKWEVINKSWDIVANKQAPATVVGTMAKTGDALITTTGKVPEVIAPNLLKAAEKAGPLGTKVNGTTVGCCSEFHGANQLMLKNPTLKVTDLKFTPAIRPRTQEVIPMCKNCQIIFGSEK